MVVTDPVPVLSVPLKLLFSHLIASAKRLLGFWISLLPSHDEFVDSSPLTDQALFTKEAYGYFSIFKERFIMKANAA